MQEEIHSWMIEKGAILFEVIMYGNVPPLPIHLHVMVLKQFDLSSSYSPPWEPPKENFSLTSTSNTLILFPAHFPTF
jgi:hypothetical protein